uniref:OBP47-like domain-containing protein n=1 Tax=Graphocephala atropunctata TaxID=36148 RepID=A0A1B6LGI8_9HEMI
MQRYLVVVFTVSAVLAVSIQAEDDCLPPKPGDKHVPAWECCSVPGAVLPEETSEKMKKCAEKFPLPPRLPGPPTAELKKAHACAAECVFAESKLLTADKKLDKAAITKLFSSIVTGNKDMDALISTAIDKCFSSNTADIDQSSECKSGAKELEQCLMREGFLGCPKSLWTSSPDCEDLKAKMTKCPKFHVMLMQPPRV